MPKTQIYEVHKLVDDVATLLAERGLTPKPGGQKADDQVKAAADLLSSLGIVPGLAPEHALDLDGHKSYSFRMHGD
ncbi:MAG: hypothetical protein JO285_09305 [Kutzneria sp.]|nr:hypothetical protein [Kutzneria sp.]